MTICYFHLILSCTINLRASKKVIFEVITKKGAITLRLFLIKYILAISYPLEIAPISAINLSPKVSASS